MAKRVAKNLGIIIASIILGFIPPAIIAMSIEANIIDINLSVEVLIIIWLLFTIVFSFPIKRFLDKNIKTRKGKWQTPTQIRDRVISTPQFVGRLDKENGLLETTARMVELDMVNQPTYWNPNGEEYNVIRLRGEILDQNGSPREIIPVEIKAKRKDWVGSIADGDRIRVDGKFEDDGILHADSAFNYSTNSIVGNRK
jgi:hypothetical protein